MFHHNFASTTWHFPVFNVLNNRIIKYDSNWKLPFVRCMVGIFYALSSCIDLFRFWPISSQCTLSIPLKTSENLAVFWCIQEVKKECIGNKWVNCVLFCTYFFVYWVSSSISVVSWVFLSFKWRMTIFGFYWLYYFRWIFFFKGDILALDIPGFASISSCWILFSFSITSFFLPLQLFSLVGVTMQH